MKKFIKSIQTLVSFFLSFELKAYLLYTYMWF